MKNKPAILCILDGWGIRGTRKANAVVLGKTPNYDYLIKNFPNSKLRADGEFVGLTKNQVGNSEVGHLTIGSGREVMMSLPKINKDIEDDTLISVEVIQSFVKAVHTSGGVAHLVGLVSEGGVHSHRDHMVYLANSFARFGVKVLLHCFLDGRDAPPFSAAKIIEALEADVDHRVKIATLIGRFYAMDRDNRWERIEKCYRLLVEGVGERFETAISGVKSKYQKNESDEFIEPLVIGNYNGFSKDADGFFFVNFRTDRAREILEAVFSPHFKMFNRPKDFDFVAACGLVEYHEDFRPFLNSVYTPERVKNTLGDWLSKKNKTQFRIAETEKYPHVTFFFNAGAERAVPGEKRLMVPSPRVLTYDKKPEMSALELIKKLTEAIESKKYDFILANFANPDMVGHTGDLRAAIKACEIVDHCLGQIIEMSKKVDSVLLVTSDHGNCELMYDDKNQSPHTAHTLNLVPFIVMGFGTSILVGDGALKDIAPTVLDIMGIEKPIEMTGESLIEIKRTSVLD